MTRVEWDTKKERANIRNHGVNFTIANRVFNDPARVEFYDTKHSTATEDRYNVIGLVNCLLFVVYTERVSVNGDDIIRIISARKADSSEEAIYANIAH